MSEPEIVIVGAGISGLALARELEAAGRSFRLLEAASRPGGVIETRTVEGHRLELGPQRLRELPEVRALLSEIEGPHHRPPPLPVLVARGGRLHPLPRTLREAAATPALSIRGRIRAALEPLAAVRHPATRISTTMSAGEFLRLRIGPEAYRAFAGPLLGGLYGSDPDRMDALRTLVPAMEALGIGSFVRHLSARSLMTAPVVVPRGGMEALPRRMAATLRGARHGELLLDSPVRRVVPDRSGGARFRVETDGSSTAARDLVFTTPPDVTAALLRPLAPDAAGRLASLRMNSIVLVHLEADTLPIGLGFQVAFGEERRIRGATFAGNLDGSGRAALVYLGGMADPGAAEAPDEVLRSLARDEFRAVTGIHARALHVHRTRMPAWDRSWRVLDGLELPAGVHLLTNYTGRAGIIGRLREAERLARAFQRGGS